MYRHAIKDLIEWKNNPKHLPLIIKGARQVGKTWLMQEFGKKEYKKVAYVSFDSNPRLDIYFREI
jgi:predicted AAA+ superfamily ATPase